MVHQTLVPVTFSQDLHNSLQEQDVMRINLSDRLLHPLVEHQQSSMLLIRWLIQWVVPRHPCVVLVMLGEMFPDFDGTVLEVEVFPDWAGECSA